MPAGVIVSSFRSDIRKYQHRLLRLTLCSKKHYNTKTFKSKRNASLASGGQLLCLESTHPISQYHQQHHTVQYLQAEGPFPMLRFEWFNEVSREWLSLCLLSCNSSALIARFCLEGTFTRWCVYVSSPLWRNKLFMFLTRSSSFTDCLVKGLSELRGTKSRRGRCSLKFIL